MLFDSKLCNSVTVKSQAHANSVLVILQLHHVDGKWNTWMVITRSLLPQNNVNLPLPFFGGNFPIVILDNIY